VKVFNTDGPCLPQKHYMLSPEPRLPTARRFAEDGLYFTLHAPQQTGKTTTLRMLAERLNAEGRHAAIVVSCGSAKVAEDDYGQAEELILHRLRLSAGKLDLALRPPDPWPSAPAGLRLHSALAGWAKQCPLPLVIFFDEIGALHGMSLVSILSQLWTGRNGTAPFPSSVALCGLRDVNVESLRIENFSLAEVTELYGRHTEVTGQVFTPQAIQRAFEASQGQPWLVNALARETVEKLGLAPSDPVTDAHMDEAIERLIVARATHFDSLAARLHEPRVKRVIEPMLAGTFLSADPTYDDDLSYTRDLGLITRSVPLQIANPMYQEVIVRTLTERLEASIHVDPRAFLQPDGCLDIDLLLAEFTAFWRLNGADLAQRQSFSEAACQLVFMAYLQRVVNGGGRIDREYAVGFGRVDLLVRKSLPPACGGRAEQWEAIELKVHRAGRPDPADEGKSQLDAYLQRLGLDHGALIIFDARPGRPAGQADSPPTRVKSPTGRTITLLRV